MGLSIVIGILCAALSIAFTNLTAFFFKVRKRFINFVIYRHQILYVLIVTILTMLVTYPGTFGEYMSLPSYSTIAKLFTYVPDNGADENDSATPAQDWGRWGIIPSLSVMLICRFFLTAASIPLPVPLGLYVTNLIIGAVFGRLLGEVALLIGIPVLPSAISMISAAAYVGAVTHTFSSSIVLLELTGDMHYMLDVALATVIAISLSRLGTDSIFDRIVRLRSLPYIYDLKYIPKPIYAKDIMIHNITPLDNIVSYKYLKEFMDKQSKEKKTTYYPVIDHERKQLLGSVPRSEIEHILKKFDDEPEKVLSTKKFHLRYDKVQFTVMKDTSLQQIHLFFITGHLSFAFVTHEGSPVGLITREELANALEGQYQFV